MESLINQAFQHVDVIGEHVKAGHYDLVGPSGEIILPSLWDAIIEPDWQITMHMWPMPEPEPESEPEPKDDEPAIVIPPDLAPGEGLTLEDILGGGIGGGGGSNKSKDKSKGKYGLDDALKSQSASVHLISMNC